MTVLAGLGLRLRLARVGVALAAGDELVDRTLMAYEQGADLVVVRPAARSDQSTLGGQLQQIRGRAPRSSLLGVEMGPPTATPDPIAALVCDLGLDVVLVAADGSVPHAVAAAHRWALIGRYGTEVAPDADFGWLTATSSVSAATTGATPAEPTAAPWFVAADRPAELTGLIGRGARRMWTADAEQVAPIAAALARAWQQDPAMSAYRYAVAGLPERRVR